MRTTHAIVERADALVPLLEQHRPYGEAHARLAPEVVADCRDAGMYGLYAPVEVGGEEAPYRTCSRRWSRSPPLIRLQPG